MVKIITILKSFNKRHRIGLFILACIGILSLIFDFLHFQFPAFLTIKINDVENFYNTVFQIQATVAILSIALLSLLSGYNEKYFGISVSKYVMFIKPKVLNFSTLITFSLLSILVNYASTGYKLHNFSVYILLVSILIPLKMSKDALYLLNHNDSLKSEMKEYIISLLCSKTDYLKEITEIKSYMLEVLKTNDSINFDQFLDVLTEAYETILKNKIIDDNQVIIYNTTFTDIIIYLFQSKKSQHFEKATELLIKIYKTSNANNKSKQSYTFVDIWDHVNRDYYNYLRNYDFDYNSFWINFKELRQELLDNIGTYESEYHIKTQTHNFEYYTIWTYNIIKSNLQLIGSLTNQSFRKQWLEFFQYYSFRDYEHFHDDSNTLFALKKSIIEKEILFYLKSLIDAKDKDQFTELYFENILDPYKINPKYYNTIVINIAVYLYYISLREPLISKSEAEIYKSWLIEKKDCFRYWIVNNLFNLGEITLEINIEYSNWEKFDKNNGKRIILDDIKTEFSIFLNLISLKYTDSIKYLIDYKTYLNSPTYLLMEYFSNENYVDTLKNFNEFCNLFYPDMNKYEAEKRLQFLHNELKQRYKNEEVENVRKIDQGKIHDDNQIDILLKKISDKQFDLFSTQPQNVKTGKSQILRIYTESDFFTDRDNSYFENEIEQGLCNLFLTVLKNNIIIKNVPIMSDNLMSEFLKLMHQHADFKPTAIIGYDNIRYQGTEEENLEFSEKLSEVKKIDLPGSFRLAVLLEISKIYFKITNTEVIIRSLNEDEISQIYQENEMGNYIYQSSNVTILEFEKDEFFEFIKKKRKVIEMYCDYSYGTISDFVGYGIKMIIDEKNSN